MKRSFLITCCIFLLLFSCKKKDESLPVQPNTFSVKVNGVVWQSNGLALFTKNNQVCIGADSATKEGYWLCTFGINNISLDSAQSTIYPTAGSSSGQIWCNANMGDGIADELHDYWDVIKTADNKVSIESYDEQKKRIKGTFHLSLYRKFDLSKPSFLGYADTLVFTDGMFDMTVKESQ